MLKISSKLFIIILILLCSSQAFSAQKFISFDFGMNSLLMPTDDRMTTNSNYFLISFPAGYKTKVGILSETATANGTDGAVNIQGSARIQGLRFT
ncbi:MAG: hypothetical protein GY756_08795, partial [bacterium]|nr:hypothetical protein [bacterium]